MRRDDELHFEHDPAFLDSLLLDGDAAAMETAAFGTGGAPADVTLSDAMHANAVAVEDGSLTWDELMAGLDDLPHMYVGMSCRADPCCIFDGTLLVAACIVSVFCMAASMNSGKANCTHTLRSTDIVRCTWRTQPGG